MYENGCYCPGDCNCNFPDRTNFCGCKAHLRENSPEEDDFDPSPTANGLPYEVKLHEAE
jgi:hypothetical protein